MIPESILPYEHYTWLLVEVLGNQLQQNLSKFINYDSTRTKSPNKLNFVVLLVEFATIHGIQIDPQYLRSVKLPKNQ